MASPVTTRQLLSGGPFVAKGWTELSRPHVCSIPIAACFREASSRLSRVQASWNLPRKPSRKRASCRALSSGLGHTWVVVAATSASADVSGAEVEESPSVVKLKEFLSDLQTVGRVRIIVNTGMGVLESVTTLEGLFHAPFPGKGVYANVIKAEDNVDFHLLLSEVAKVSLVTAKSRSGDFLTHTARFQSKDGQNNTSIFVMWKPGTKGDYNDGQVEAFQKIVEKYGEELVL